MPVCFLTQSTWFFNGIIKKIFLKEVSRADVAHETILFIIIIVRDSTCWWSTLNEAWCQQLYINCRTDGETEAATGRVGEWGRGAELGLATSAFIRARAHCPSCSLLLSGSTMAVEFPHLLLSIPVEQASDQQLLLLWLFLNNYRFISCLHIWSLGNRVWRRPCFGF